GNHNARALALAHVAPTTTADPATRQRHAHPSAAHRVRPSRPDRIIHRPVARWRARRATILRDRPGTESVTRPPAYVPCPAPDRDGGGRAARAPGLARDSGARSPTRRNQTLCPVQPNFRVSK